MSVNLLAWISSPLAVIKLVIKPGVAVPCGVPCRAGHRLSSVVLSAVLLSVLVACGGGGGGGTPTNGASADTATGGDPSSGGGDTGVCGVDSQKTFVKQVADDWYLWYDEMAVVDPAEFNDAQSYLNALTAPLASDDRDPGFSYLTTREQDEAALNSGAYVGFGFRYGFDEANRLRFSDVFEGGPAGDAEIQRSDILLAIDTGNGFETTEQLAARNASNEEIFGPSELGVERAFRIQQGTETREVTLVKRELVTPALAGLPRLIEREGLSPVGYVHMRAFINSAENPLNNMAQTFANAGVSDLIVDFRYNGGGLLSVAEQLLNVLAGEAATGQESFRISHNVKRSNENVSTFFARPQAPLSPLRIAFIVTGATASASELVINSIAPYIDLVMVGEDTLGKAVGQYAFDQSGCETRLRLVSFEIVNGEGQGGYYTGLADTGRFTLCPAQDDLTRPFTDSRENSLSVALDWLSSGACSAVAAKRAVDPYAPLPDWGLARQVDKPFGRSPWVQ